MKRFFLFCLATLMPVWCLAQTDSVILRPNADFSNTGNRWRQDSIIAGAILGTICGTSDLWFRLKETQNGKDDSGYVEIDNDALAGNCLLAGCNAFNADNGYKVDFDDYSTQKSYVPDSYAVYARSYACNAVDTTVFSVSFYDRLSSDLGVTRLGKASATGSYVTKRIGSGSTDGQGTALSSGLMDSLIVRMKGYVSGAGGESHHTQVYVVAYFSTPIISTQPSQGPETAAGDTLYPDANGSSVALSTACAANWQCVKDSGTQITGGCSSVANDSNFVASATPTSDYYSLNDYTGTGTKQIDCIAIEVCVSLSAAVNLGRLSFGIRMPGGTEDTCGVITLATSTARQSFVYYVPHDPRDPNTRFNNNTLDSVEAKVKLWRTSGTATVNVHNVFVIVYSSTRSTAICDSTNSNMQALAYDNANATAPLWIMNRSSGCFQSPDTTRKIWITFGHLSGTDTTLYVGASNDSGITWTYANPDTVRVEVKSGTSPPGAISGFSGPMITGDATGSGQDSFWIMMIRGAANTTSDSIILRSSKNPSIANTDIQDRRFVQDPGNLLTGIFQPSIYVRKNQIWIFFQDSTTAGPVRFRWSDDGGANWRPTNGGMNLLPDSGGNNRGCRLNSTTSNRRVIPVRWTDNYPAVFLTGFTSGVDRVNFYQWHNDQTDSTKKWMQSASGGRDTIRVLNISGAQNSGEMVATSVFGTGTANTDTIGHVAVVRGTRIIHASVNANESVIEIDTVVEQSHNAGASLFISMAAKDTFVYIFYNYLLTPTTSSNVRIFYQLFPYKPTAANKFFRGPRRFSFVDGSNTQQRFPTTAPYQKGNFVFGMFQGHLNANATWDRILFNRIIKPTAAAATQDDRRRRILMGRREDEESDSLMLSVRSILGK